MNYKKLLEDNNIETRTIRSVQEVFSESSPLVNIKEEGGNVADEVFDTLMDKSIRRGDGTLYFNEIVEMKNKIGISVKDKRAVEFVFQGFPFKCHNPFETMRRTPDLGEVAFLVRLGDINETIKQIHPPGVKFVVLGEGHTYKSLFGASENELEVFAEKCGEFSRKLGLGDTVSFVDFTKLLDDKEAFFTECDNQERLIKQGRSSEEINQLTHVMMRSLPTIQDVLYTDLLALFATKNNLEGLTTTQLKLLEQLSLEGEELAIRYIAIQNAKKGADVVSKKFPNHLYISTTAKKERYSFHPIHRRTRLYPHHGVPVLGSDKVEVEFLGEIISNPDIYTAVYCSDDVEDAPFYFLKGRQHRKK